MASTTFCLSVVGFTTGRTDPAVVYSETSTPSGSSANSALRPFRVGLIGLVFDRPLSTRYCSFVGQSTASTFVVLQDVPSSVTVTSWVVTPSTRLPSGDVMLRNIWPCFWAERDVARTRAPKTTVKDHRMVARISPPCRSYTSRTFRCCCLPRADRAILVLSPDLVSIVRR